MCIVASRKKTAKSIKKAAQLHQIVYSLHPLTISL